jgi:hypothetical protein
VNKVRFGILIIFASLLLLSSWYYPAFGMVEDQNELVSLSGAAYTFHSINPSGTLLPIATCQVCHPGPQSQDLREALASMGVSCTDCHGGMSSLDLPQPIRGIKLLTCASCHADTVIAGFTHDIMESNPENSAPYLMLAPAGYEIQSNGEVGLSRPYKVLISYRTAEMGQFSSLQGGAISNPVCQACHTQPDQEAFWHSVIEE